MELLPDFALREDLWQDHLNFESMPSLDLRVPTIFPYSDAIISYLQRLSTLEPHLGIALENHQNVEVLVPYLDYISLIALNFPKFSDGRAYSQARELRTNLYFKGTLRATGDVLPPQVSFMRRCGFDSIIVDTSRFAATVWENALRHYTDVYQGDPLHKGQTEDIPLSILQKRSMSS